MVMTMRRRERRLKLILMIYTALIFVGMSSYYNLSVVVESFAFVSITPNNMISSSPSSPEQRRRRRKISCNDDFHRRRRKRKFTEIYTQLSSSKKSEAEEETDIASTTINSDSDSIRKLLSDLNKNKNNNDDGFGEYFDFDGEIQEMDDAMMEEIKEGQPSEFNIMKELLGINIFTFILAGLIVFFLGMNYILGPGWLGSTIGIPGTGSFDEVSPSIPGMIDLNKPEFRL